MPNLFIIGNSQVGKSTLAKNLAEIFHYKHIGASEWVRSKFPPNVSREELTSYSVEQLALNPNVCVDYIRNKYDLENDSFIIEGIRNPFDFVKLWNPQTDHIIFLSHDRTTPNYPPLMDSGTSLIKEIRSWAETMNITPTSYISFKLYEFEGKDTIVPSIRDAEPGERINVGNMKQLIRLSEAWYKRQLATTLPPETKIRTGEVHLSISPINVEVADSLFYQNDSSSWTKGQLIGLSSYPGSTLTGIVLLENGSLFHYVPFHLMRTKEVEQALSLSDLVYHNCPNEKVILAHSEILGSKPVRAYFKEYNLFLDATYLGTIDWFTGNDLLHFLLLSNGQFALLPNHKVLFGGKDFFHPYKKIRQTWSVGAAPDCPSEPL